MSVDTKFFTNEGDDTLLKRFQKTLSHAQNFDVLVGYFRASGFTPLAEALGDVEKIRILVGLNVDSAVMDAGISASENTLPHISSHAEVHSEYSRIVQQEMESAPETRDTEDSISLFIDYLKNGRIEVRGHPSRNIHAKVYILHYNDSQATAGCVITGSSNFTRLGLTAQREFNVELRDPGDMEFASSQFEKLWEESVDLTDEFRNTVNRKTWFNREISPYELYLKFLYEYFKEDINLDESDSAILPDGFIELEYQKQAVIAAKKILEAHDGVFLADVVGLGKTFIASMLLQNLPGRKLVICPPILVPYWEEALRAFYVHPFRVISSGKITDVSLPESAKYSYVVVDESHRFRNEKTQSYEILKKICLGKKVVLLSATPYNNRLSDLLAQIKLFQSGKDSTIPGIKNIEAFFKKQENELKFLNPGNPDEKVIAEQIAAKVRDRVLKHIMIRRTRKEVAKFFSADIEANGLSFLEVEQPKALIYQFNPVIDTAFNRTIQLLVSLNYSRYTPLLYLKSGANQIQTLSQNNIKGFIKSIIVKRLESSFYAFSQTIKRFIQSYNAFIEALKQGHIFIGKHIDVNDLLDLDDMDAVEEILNKKGVDVYNADDFDGQLLPDLESDLAALRKIDDIWSVVSDDPKYDTLLDNIKNNAILNCERILIFSESRETAEYLYRKLELALPRSALMFSSQSALYAGKNKSAKEARNLVRANFDPTEPESNDFRILITTDILAEGMNLHRAARIINYDLPWNPTRVMQRLGRINRVGTAHDKLYIFNFFPTAQADAHLGLQENIARKITAFNAVLGNDNKILYEDEVPDPHGLFRRLTMLAQDEDEDSELEYLQAIRQIRDDEPALFEKIKNLPPKARSAYRNPLHPDKLIVFFREGALKKFVDVGIEARELTLLEAAPLMRANITDKRVSLPPDYYQRLVIARKCLEDEEPAVVECARTTPASKSLLAAIRMLQHRHEMTELDLEYLDRLYKAVDQSALAKKSISKLAAECKKSHSSPLALLNALRQIMPDATLPTHEAQIPIKQPRKSRQIVLAQYLAP